MEKYTDELFDFDDVGEEDEEKSLLPVEFTDCFKRLPASAPADHAHLVDLSKYHPDMEEESYDVKVWDAVCTMLFNISTETLNDFLDPNVRTFQLIQEFDEGMSRAKLVIWRQSNKTLFAQYIVYPKESLLEFDNLIRCTVNYDGSWTIDAASFGKYTRNDLNNAWAGSFVTTRINRGMSVHDAKNQADFARILGEYILQNECWSADGGSKWTIKKT